MHTKQARGRQCRLAAAVLGCLVWAAAINMASAEQIGTGDVYSVIDVVLSGPGQEAKDTPARDIDLAAVFRHEDGTPITVHGFWDGDGRGGKRRRVRGSLLPDQAGPLDTGRSEVEPRGVGRATSGRLPHGRSRRRGMASGRWTTRARAAVGTAAPTDRTSSSSATPITVSFPAMAREGKPSGNDIAADVRRNAEFFKKLRFSLCGCRYPHPVEKPFFDDAGRPTDDGDFSHRPNPRWFHQRADLAVQTALRGRPDRRPDPLRAGYGRRAVDAAGRRQRRRPHTVAALHRRPLRQLSQRLALSVQRIRHQVAEVHAAADRRALGKRSSDSCPIPRR